MQKFIVIQQHAWSNDHGYGIGYSSDLEIFDKREVAISHGFEVAGCDDFNIGVIEDGGPVSLDWMEKPVGNGKGVSVRNSRLSLMPLAWRHHDSHPQRQAVHRQKA